jgi:hypothetical protein
MPTKIFTTRRQWHNTLLMVWMSPFLLLIGVLSLAMYGKIPGLIAAGVLVVVGTVIALLRDLTAQSIYTVKQDVLTLSNRSGEVQYHMNDVVDASLIDRMAAREYIRSHALQRDPNLSPKKFQKEFVRFCSVDIGLNSFTLGLGRSVIDRLPMSKQDLVLLRLRNGQAYLLSPKYNQDLVATLNRAISARMGDQL